MIELIMNLKAIEKRIAVHEDDKLVELLIDRPDTHQIEGNIYIGRVVNVLPGMQAAFVDIGQRKHGFIHRDHLCSFQTSILSKSEKDQKGISHFVQQGEAILVQVVKEGDGTKGPNLTGLLEFPGTNLVYQPYGKYKAISKKMSDPKRKEWRKHLGEWLTAEEGVILRTASEHEDTNVVAAELMDLQQQFLHVQQQADTTKKIPALLLEEDHFVSKLIREIPPHEVKLIEVDDAPTFQHLKRKGYPLRFYQGKENLFKRRGMEQELEKALKKIVWLPSGGYIIIEHTEAMTVIDVNSGKYTGKTALSDTVLKINKEAAIEIARQLRLRQIGGIIIIDFIDMKSNEEREQVKALMETTVKKDRSMVRVVGFTDLNLLQVTRKKNRQPLTSLLQAPCTSCEGKGTTYSTKTLAYKLERELLELIGSDAEAVIIEAHPTVAESFFRLPDVKERIAIPLYFVEKAEKDSFDVIFVGSEMDATERLKSLEPY